MHNIDPLASSGVFEDRIIFIILSKFSTETDSEWKREAIAEYQSDTACEACNGDRLKEEALCVKIN
ncbi:hypothetical protein IDH04_02825, partial [Pelagibacterales bacterium SAG-MED10]|nr:hypothetical protein [Pelagibacterales bacterium SAG-MED10]